MKTKQRSTDLPETTRPTGIESVMFRDGMIVTADDLDAAMRYPASMLHTVLRSYFGCGVVCGLGLEVKDAPGKRPNWVVCVDRGVAIDCHGHPLELCAPVELDLSPDPCACEPPPAEICIAIRRSTSDEAPQDPCGCDLDGPHFDCRRTRDHIVIKAFSREEFDALPATVCKRTDVEAEKPEKPGEPTPGSEDGEQRGRPGDPFCDCLTTCHDRSCGDCWILLGCVDIYQEKPDLEGIDGKPNTDGRPWVKPIECWCAPGAGRDRLEDRIETLEHLVKDLVEAHETESPSETVN